MSLQKVVSIECPFCHKPFETDVYCSYNVQEEKGLDKIFSNEIVLHICPHCQKTVLYLTTFVFHDAEKSILIFFYPNSRESTERIQENVDAVCKQKQVPSSYIKRIITTTYDDLKEKILILESGLDDRVCEVYKQHIQANNNAKSIRAVRFIIDQTLSPKGIAMFTDQAKPMVEFFDMNLYRSLEKQLQHLK